LIANSVCPPCLRARRLTAQSECRQGRKHNQVKTDTLERQHGLLCRRIGYARAKSAVKPWFCSAFGRAALDLNVSGSAAHFQFDLISIEFQVGSISLTRASQTGSASPSNSLDSVIEIKAEFQRANHPPHPLRDLIDKRQVERWLEELSFCSSWIQWGWVASKGVVD